MDSFSHSSCSVVTCRAHTNKHTNTHTDILIASPTLCCFGNHFHPRQGKERPCNDKYEPLRCWWHHHSRRCEQAPAAPDSQWRWECLWHCHKQDGRAKYQRELSVDQCAHGHKHAQIHMHSVLGASMQTSHARVESDGEDIGHFSRSLQQNGRAAHLVRGQQAPNDSNRHLKDVDISLCQHQTMLTE